MPKLKTHKGAAKRFKKTGTGKITRRHANARHILTSKTRSRKRKLGQGVVADEADQAKLKEMLPYYGSQTKDHRAGAARCTCLTSLQGTILFLILKRRKRAKSKKRY